jgi:HEAT repeat protein
MGPAAAAAVPGLIDALRAVRPSGHKMPALGADSRTPATPTNTPSPSPPPEETSRAYAAQALGRIGPAALSAIPALTQAAADSNEQISASAKLALKQVQGLV